MTSASVAEPRHHLLKILGVSFGVAVAVGDMIGSGILRSPGVVAGEVPGAAVILGLWVLGGVQASMSANIVAELATALPKSGGTYIYAHRAFGDVGGLIVGWADWLSFLAGTAAASVSFAEFLPAIWPQAGEHKIAVALALQVALYAANIAGLREGRALQEVTSFVKAAMLLAFIVAAVVLAAPAEPVTAFFAAPLWHWANIVLAYQLIMGAYAGWAAPVNFTGENIAPARSIPRALALGIAVTGTLYVGINAALLYTLGAHGVAVSALPFAAVLERLGGALPSFLFALTATITVASCANANVMAAPRVLLALAEDGLLPRAFRSVNAGGSPAGGFLLSGLGSVALALSGTFALVFGLIGTLNAVAAVLTESAYFVLRRREPLLARPFRAFGHPVLPAAALAFDAAMLCLFASADHRGVAVALGLGLLCVPFALVARRSRASRNADDSRRGQE